MSDKTEARGSRPRGSHMGMYLPFDGPNAGASRDPLRAYYPGPRLVVPARAGPTSAAAPYQHSDLSLSNIEARADTTRSQPCSAIASVQRRTTGGMIEGRVPLSAEEFPKFLNLIPSGRLYTVRNGSRENPVNLISPTTPSHNVPRSDLVHGMTGNMVAGIELEDEVQRYFILFLHLHKATSKEICSQFEAKPFVKPKGWMEENRLQVSLKNGSITKRPDTLNDKAALSRAERDGSLARLVNAQVRKTINLAFRGRWNFNLQRIQKGTRNTKEQKEYFKNNRNYHRDRVIRLDRIEQLLKPGDILPDDIYNDEFYDWKQERVFLTEKLEDAWRKEIEKTG